MNFINILILLILCICCTKSKKSTVFTALHYNIQELTTYKLQNPGKQLAEVKKAISHLKPDIFSINEIQYDLINVPSSSFKSSGENLNKLKKFLGYDYLKNQSFIIANTGKNAKRQSNGKYHTQINKKNANSYIDLVNFGLFPAQYSTGALYRFEAKKVDIIRNLRWLHFFPEDELKKFSLANGKRIPHNIELFDKSFSDTLLKINDKEVHLILLHAVPAYNFGNKNSINILRNKRQLDFLRWYVNVDGASYITAGIHPLKENSSFIIMGDLNVDINSSKPGAQSLKKLISFTQPWIKQDKMKATHPKGSLILDYILTSPDIKIIDGKILRQASSTASDHLPIWGKFEIN
jgi:hypothetical protein